MTDRQIYMPGAAERDEFDGTSHLAERATRIM